MCRCRVSWWNNAVTLNLLPPYSTPVSPLQSNHTVPMRMGFISCILKICTHTYTHTAILCVQIICLDGDCVIACYRYIQSPNKCQHQLHLFIRMQTHTRTLFLYWKWHLHRLPKPFLKFFQLRKFFFPLIITSGRFFALVWDPKWVSGRSETEGSNNAHR